MKDHSEEVAQFVARYEDIELVTLRIRDAFDRSWWEKVGGMAACSGHGIVLSNECEYPAFSPPPPYSHSVTSPANRVTSRHEFRSPYRSTCIPLFPTNPYRGAFFGSNPHTALTTPHRCTNRLLAPRPGDLTHQSCGFPHLGCRTGLWVHSARGVV